MFPEWSSALVWWQWVILAAVPPAVVLLYFLKLKRTPLEVPSTYLWHKSIEDLNVNSLWQRLRRNLLLLLQLLLIALAMLALLQPGWRSQILSGDRFIFLIDNSASMNATDVAPSRLAEAKRQVLELIGEMDSADVAMVVSFSDTARVEQTFTGNRRELRAAVEAIEPTERRTSLVEAIKVSSGLANPGRSGEDITDERVAEALPAKLFIVSDGKFPDVDDLALGTLDAVYIPIGQPDAANVAIVAFDTRRHSRQDDRLQAFAQMVNFGSEPVVVDAELFLDAQSEPFDVARETIPPNGVWSEPFPMVGVESGVLELRLSVDDALEVDNRAWTIINPPEPVPVLVVSPGNEPLQWALTTGPARRLASVQVEPPEFLATDTYRQQAAGRAWSLLIYDRCGPETMPQANTLFIGSVPKHPGWSAGPRIEAPMIVDADPAHPLMQFVTVDQELIAAATPLSFPSGGSVLIDAGDQPLLAIAPREGFEDAVLGFELVGVRSDGQMGLRTTWPRRLSFAVFLQNCIEYLGGAGRADSANRYRPGESVTLENPDPEQSFQVRSPRGKVTNPRGGTQGRFQFRETTEVGEYKVESGGSTAGRFVVNLFDRAESDVATRAQGAIRIGYVEIPDDSGWEPTRTDLWKGLLLLGLAVLLLEWYTYTRRIRL